VTEEQNTNSGLRKAVCELDGVNKGRSVYVEEQVPIALVRQISKLEIGGIDFTDEGSTYRDLYELYAQVIPVWDLVKPNRKSGRMENLPNPVEDPMVFDQLSMEMLMWISGQIWGNDTENPTTSG